MDPGSPPQKRWRFVYLLSVAHRRVHAFIQGSADGHTAARAGLLMAIPPDEGVPMAQLAQVLDMGAPALSGLLDRAVRAGLVKRQADPADGRAWIIALTRAGKAARQEAVLGARELNARLCEGFTPEELDVVGRWLQAVRHKFPPLEDPERKEPEP